eukprot:comp19361_c0_seq1/m.22307 comp19361_c0_seq1/g.22307  ORF comp19361_c0_seq1/g.22307 comp19361_c0_seq1/m.22307 type:complete len:243 (-) comp19361_c0_seq1:245-973(-)
MHVLRLSTWSVRSAPVACRQLGTTLQAPCRRRYATDAPATTAVAPTGEELKKTASTLNRALERAAEKAVTPEFDNILFFMKESDFKRLEKLRNAMPFRTKEVSGGTIHMQADIAGERVDVTFGVRVPDTHLGYQGTTADGIGFTVRILRETGKTLHVKLRARGGQLSLQQIYLGQAGKEESQPDYHGPPVTKLEPALVHSMIEYLESRGIDQTLASFVELVNYEKSEKEYVAWLKRFAALTS